MVDRKKGIGKRCSDKDPMKALPSGVIFVKRVEKIKVELRSRSVHVPPVLYGVQKEDDKRSTSNPASVEMIRTLWRSNVERKKLSNDRRSRTVCLLLEAAL